MSIQTPGLTPQNLGSRQEHLYQLPLHHCRRTPLQSTALSEDTNPEHGTVGGHHRRRTPLLEDTIAKGHNRQDHMESHLHSLTI